MKVSAKEREEVGERKQNRKVVKDEIDLEALHEEVMARKELVTGNEEIQEFGYAAVCNQLGASNYWVLPPNIVFPKCSGQTEMISKKVLNETMVSVSTLRTEKTKKFILRPTKTWVEECIEQYEDERFELDIVVESNAAALRCLESALKKLNMIPKEKQRDFKLMHHLGHTSPVMLDIVVKKLYGELVAVDILKGLWNCPVETIPIVVRRLKQAEKKTNVLMSILNKAFEKKLQLTLSLIIPASEKIRGGTVDEAMMSYLTGK